MSAPGEHGSPAGQADAAGKVGYRHPPEEHRFKKGVSGNPKGRPRTRPQGEGPSLEWIDIVSKVTGRKIRATENGTARTMTSFEGVLRVVEAKAMKGDMHAARLYFEANKAADLERRRERQRRYDRQVKYKQSAAANIRFNDAHGLAQLNPVPHPDDMQVDCARELVTIIGPANDAEKVAWDESEAERQALVVTVARYRQLLTGPDKALKGEFKKSRTLVLQRLDQANEQLAALDAKFPTKELRRRRGQMDRQSQRLIENVRVEPVIRPAADEARGSSDDRRLDQAARDRIGQADEVPAQIKKQLDAFKGSSTATPATPVTPVTQTEWDKSEALRRKLATQVRDFEEVLTCSDAKLEAVHGWDREFFQAQLAWSEDNLELLDAFYPPPERRQEPDFDLQHWRKRHGRGRRPPDLWSYPPRSP